MNLFELTPFVPRSVELLIICVRRDRSRPYSEITADRIGLRSFASGPGCIPSPRTKLDPYCPQQPICGMRGAPECDRRLRCIAKVPIWFATLNSSSCRSPIQLLIRRWKECNPPMTASMARWEILPGKRENVDDSRVPAASDHDNPSGC